MFFWKLKLCSASATCSRSAKSLHPIENVYTECVENYNCTPYLGVLVSIADKIPHRGILVLAWQQAVAPLRLNSKIWWTHRGSRVTLTRSKWRYDDCTVLYRIWWHADKITHRFGRLGSRIRRTTKVTKSWYSSTRTWTILPPEMFLTGRQPKLGGMRTIVT